MPLSHLRPGSTDTPRVQRRHEKPCAALVTQLLSLSVTAFLPVDTAPRGPIISPARKDAESEPPVTETETRDKLEALQERLTTLRDSL
jgi:hypothetical protein